MVASQNLQSNMFVAMCEVDDYTHIGIVVHDSGHVQWWHGRMTLQGFVYNPDAHGQVLNPELAADLVRLDGTINPLVAVHLACYIEKTANPPAPAA